MELDIFQYERIIEALLFAWGDPLELDKIAEVLDIDRRSARSVMNSIMDRYKAEGRSILIREIADAYQLYTSQDYNEYIIKLVEPRQRATLSQAAYETLSIIAYNQPATRAKIEHIRGVNSDSAVVKLLERNLVKEAGRLDAPGKPILYETTEEFLKSFGFKSISDLPRMDELMGTELEKDALLANQGFNPNNESH